MSNFTITTAVLFCIQAMFVLCICYAIVSDFTRLRIDNWIPATLVSLFVAYAALRLSWAAVSGHVVVALVVFALGFASFILGFIGGGDVKLLTALALWAGPAHGPDLLVATTIGGGIMAATLLYLRHSADARQSLPKSAPFQRIRAFAERGVCPYGLAMGTGALIALYPMFQSTI
jgi:prepilin peptidase CpaA